MSNETKHTPDPWKATEGSTHMWVANAVTGNTLFAIHRENNPNAEVNARRIVACVNACAGLDDNTLPYVSSGVKMVRDIQTQRNELAAELRETLVDLKGWDGSPEAMEVIQENITAALAKL